MDVWVTSRDSILGHPRAMLAYGNQCQILGPLRMGEGWVRLQTWGVSPSPPVAPSSFPA